MPYIKSELRQELDGDIEALAVKINALSEGNTEPAAGLINYSCTRLVLRILTLSGKKFNYATLALISGVFSNIQTEFYRQKGVPYEEQKMAENGDLDWS